MASSPSPAHPSRRALVRGAAWTAPAIVAITAAPAHAAASSRLSAALSAASFRTDSEAGLAAGTPTAGTAGLAAFAAIQINLTATVPPLRNLTCTLTTAGAGAIPVGGIVGSASAAARSGVTWLANNASLAAEGWSASPTTGTLRTVQFTQSNFANNRTSFPLKIVIGGFDLEDSPLTFSFASSDSPLAVATIQVRRSTMSPFLSV